MAYLSGSHAPPAAPAGNHGGGGCPRKTAALGTGKPADKLICRQRFFLPGKRPQRQPADLCRAPFPGRGGRRRGMERRGRQGIAGHHPHTLTPTPTVSFGKSITRRDSSRAHASNAWAPYLSQPGGAGREGNRPGAPSHPSPPLGGSAAAQGPSDP